MSAHVLMMFTDALYFGVCGFIFVVLLPLLRAGPARAAWRQVSGSETGVVSMLLLGLFLLIGLVDSLHLPQLMGGERGTSVLDSLLHRFLSGDRQSYANTVAVSMLEQSFKGVRSAWLVGMGGVVAWLPLTVLAGVAAGLAGGVLSRMVGLACDVLDAIPDVLLLVMLLFAAQPLIGVLAEHFSGAVNAGEARLLVICIALGFVRGPALCRRVRARTAEFMASDAVAAARCMGVSDAQLLRRHLLPELASMAAVAVVTAFPMLMVAEAVLSYLGMGLDPVTRSLGTVLSDALAIAVTEPSAGAVLMAALLPLGLMLAAASLFAFSVSSTFGRARH